MRYLQNGRYELIRAESENEYSTIYHALEIASPRVNSAKVMIRKWHTEVESTLKHIEIISTFDFHALPRLLKHFVEDGDTYVVYSFLYGLDLEFILSRVHKPIALEWIIDWAIQLCEVLTYLHTHTPYPLIYNNWRLNNVMVDTYQHITLVGLSHLTQSTSTNIEPPHSVIGFEIPDTRQTPMSDIYGLGTVLRSILDYQYPRSIPIEIERAASRRASHPHTMPFNAIVEKAMAPSAQDRFQSADEMKIELLKLIDA